MSLPIKDKPVSVRTFLKNKIDKIKTTMITAYDCSTAKFVDEAGIDSILVGDSVGMTVLGYENTLNVTMDEMVIFTSAVARGAKRAFVVADMPFLSCSISVEQTVKNAGRLIQAGAQAVKIEGASDMILASIKQLTDSGIAVVGHLGFTPQYINSIGGYYVQGKSAEQSIKMLEDVKKLQDAGVFAVVLEMVPAETAKIITDNVDIVTIGIGAGIDCDGQVLVVDDIIGKYSDFTPKFAKKYANIKDIIVESVKQYNSDVKELKFPSREHIFNLQDGEKEKLESYINK